LIYGYELGEQKIDSTSDTPENPEIFNRSSERLVWDVKTQTLTAYHISNEEFDERWDAAVKCAEI
jgi:hypothetical protein